MAKIRAISGNGGGGGGTATTLWTNPNTGVAFADQSVNLSEDITNYSKLRFYWKYSTTSSDITDAVYMDIPVDEYRGKTGANTQLSYSMSLLNGSGQVYTRLIIRSSDAQVRITACWRGNASGTSTSNIIPIKIEGIKY